MSPTSKPTPDFLFEACCWPILFGPYPLIAYNRRQPAMGDNSIGNNLWVDLSPAKGRRRERSQL
jgi:hypothetical protein